MGSTNGTSTNEPASRVQVRPGPVEGEVASALRRLAELEAVRRIWERDPTLWSESPDHRRVIANRLGWLTVADAMRRQVDSLRAFADEARAAGFRRAVLLGMGGSSLAPEVLRATFGPAAGFLDLDVLDTTDPATLLATVGMQHAPPLQDSLVLAASKSGTTVETRSHLAYCWERTGGRGDQFVAITDPGTPLESLARERGFRRVFLNPADIGGRYSALSAFGLVPAALLGLDLAALLERAGGMAEACAKGSDNPGLRLGAVLGAAALAGRDKVTFVASETLSPFGIWVEQLLAESTGKAGTGLVPVVDEPLGSADVYGADRLFVALRLADEAADPGLERLAAAGHPVVTIVLGDRLDLGAEFFRWEFATATAGVVLGIDPFDEPNVQESKDNTSRLLAAFGQAGQLPEPEPVAVADGLSLVGDSRATSVERGLADFLARARPGDYLALQAYVPYRESVRQGLQDVRRRLRDRLRIATTLGFGPRFLHSTGQLHKGGPATGLFLQLTADDPEDAPIPGQPFSFGVLKRAQALGDLQALQARAHPGGASPILRVHLGRDVEAGLRRLAQIVAADEADDLSS